jgi:hypothetical protein
MFSSMTMLMMQGRTFGRSGPLKLFRDSEMLTTPLTHRERGAKSHSVPR